jgi:VWFA-related protein
MLLGAAVLLAGVHTTSRVQEQRPPVFRALAEGVVVDVSVMSGRRPVGGLGAKDFELYDNGVRQTIDDASVSTMPMDMTILLDLSGSVAGVFQARLLQGVKEITTLLNRDDRAELVAFTSRARRVIDLEQVLRTKPNVQPFGDGGTAFFDALTLALMEQPDPERRRFIVALSDGLDTASVLDRRTRLSIIERSSAVVFIVAISTSRGGRTLGYRTGIGTSGSDLNQEYVGSYDWLLSEIADGTTGELFDLEPGGSFVEALSRALEAFRTRYLLRYRPVGVDSRGWHSLVVNVVTGRYETRARKGYFRGS